MEIRCYAYRQFKEVSGICARATDNGFESKVLETFRKN